MDILILLLVGAAAGMPAGLFGMGGGVIVPVLVVVFEHQGVASDVLMQSAFGTSLATIVFTAISAIRAHQARGAIRWPMVRQLAPGALVGALGGASIAHLLPSEVLKMLFGIFLLVVAAQMDA